MENVTTFRDIEDEVTDFVRNGFTPGYQIGLNNFDDIFQLTLVSLLLSLVYLLPVNLILSIKWLSVITKSMVGKRLMLLLKMYRRFSTHKLMRKHWQGMPAKEDIDTDKWNQLQIIAMTITIILIWSAIHLKLS